MKKRSGDNHYVELVVQDSGPGIPAEQLEKIFDRFYQVEDGWKKGTSGTGIGLSLTKELTVLLHGEIRVESNLQKGSRFILRLPVGKDHLKSQEYVIVEDQEIDGQSLYIKCNISENSQKVRDDTLVTTYSNDRPIVLIVDDNQDIRHHLRESLVKDFIDKRSRQWKRGT